MPFCPTGPCFLCVMGYQYVCGRCWFKWRALFLMVGYHKHSDFLSEQKSCINVWLMAICQSTCGVMVDGISSLSLLFLYFRSNLGSVGHAFSSTQTQCRLCNRLCNRETYSFAITSIAVLKHIFSWTLETKRLKCWSQQHFLSKSIGSTQWWGVYWMLLLTMIILVVKFIKFINFE